MKEKLGTVYTEWEIFDEDGNCVAGANDRAELQRYVMQYLEDGDLEIWEVKRTLVEKVSHSKHLRKAQEK